MQNMFGITSKIQSTLLSSIIYLVPKFHENPPIILRLILDTNKQTGRKTLPRQPAAE